MPINRLIISIMIIIYRNKLEVIILLVARLIAKTLQKEEEEILRLFRGFLISSLNKRFKKFPRLILDNSRP